MASEQQPTGPPPPSAAAAAAAAAQAIARAVLRRYTALPGTGKPASHEHTVLAGFVVVDTTSPESGGPRCACASLATGTKCLGGGRRREAAEAGVSLLHDSHAEALARRGLLLWVHAQLRAALLLEEEEREEEQREREDGAAAAAAAPTAAATTTMKPSTAPLCYFRWLPSRRRFALLPGVELYLYVSQPPCGDASILHEDDCGEDCGGGGGGGGEEGQEQEGAQEEAKKARPLTGRTGAKLIEPAVAVVTEAATEAAAAGSASAPLVPQAGHVEAAARPQRQGALRRKPGKGDATLSMSCSDKLARWRALGLQGALLSSVLDAPLRLSGVVVSVPPPPPPLPGDAGGDDGRGWTAAASDVEAALRRAVFERFQASIEEAADALSRQRRREDDDDDESAAGAAAKRLLRSALPRPPPPPLPPPLLLPAAMAAPPPPPALGLAPSESRRVPCGLSINWHDDANANSSNSNKAEATVGAAGCRAGSGRAARGSPATRSRLSRASLAARFAELLEALEAPRGGLVVAEEEEEEGQQRDEAGGALVPPPRRPLPLLSAEEARRLPLDELKRRAAPAYARAWAALLSARPFVSAWLRKPRDALALADYAVAEAGAPPTRTRTTTATAAGAGRGGRTVGGDDGDGDAGDDEPSKRARTADAAATR